MIDVRLLLWGWTYSKPARMGWGLALAAWGWTCNKPLSRGLAGECRWTYSEPARRVQGLALATWELDLQRTSE